MAIYKKGGEEFVSSMFNEARSDGGDSAGKSSVNAFWSLSG